jgi:AraC-like DNA-binding protein
VHPDGCRDLILVSRPGVPKAVHITGWDRHPSIVNVQAGTEFIGFRLRPGTTIAPQTFTSDDADPSVLQDRIESETPRNQDIHEVITALTQPGATLVKVARQSGTTPRTLQRQMRALSLPTPDFWRLLGRARRAIRDLPCHAPLAEIAHTYGYSDQAHMTREFVRWFGHTPSHLRKNSEVITEIGQPGLGNWLGDRLESPDLF